MINFRGLQSAPQPEPYRRCSHWTKGVLWFPVVLTSAQAPSRVFSSLHNDTHIILIMQRKHCLSEWCCVDIRKNVYLLVYTWFLVTTSFLLVRLLVLQTFGLLCPLPQEGGVREWLTYFATWPPAASLGSSVSPHPTIQDRACFTCFKLYFQPDTLPERKRGLWRTRKCPHRELEWFLGICSTCPQFPRIKTASNLIFPWHFTEDLS